jgi:LmbE family N-acetylglucosaminyl deacetylase
MHYDSLAQLNTAYDHIYLSPHLDDAALCCGGMIAGQRAAGQRVLVINLCTAAPQPDAPFSVLAREFHAKWALSPEQVIAARLAEDAAALALLDADSLGAGMLDAIYRHPAAYDSRESLFGLPAPDDPLLPALGALLADLRERQPKAHFYGPLGVGSHVDHQITCRAALEQLGDRLALYEDFPYVTRSGELERRLAALDLPLHPRPLAIDATLAQKIAAVRCYASQMVELAHSQLGQLMEPEAAAEAMAEAVSAYARSVDPAEGHSERLWLRES